MRYLSVRSRGLTAFAISASLSIGFTPRCTVSCVRGQVTGALGRMSENTAAKLMWQHDLRGNGLRYPAVSMGQDTECGVSFPRLQAERGHLFLSTNHQAQPAPGMTHPGPRSHRETRSDSVVSSVVQFAVLEESFDVDRRLQP